MAKFEVGQKVRVIGKSNLEDGLDVSKEYAIERLREGQYSYLIGKSWWMREDEIEAVITDFQSGDIVRAEKGDHMVQNETTEYGNVLWLEGCRLSSWESDGYTLTLVKRPEPEIILPTKFNALVLVDGRTWIRASNDMWFWAFGDWSGIESEKLAAKAKRFDDYRVIFEGENE